MMLRYREVRVGNINIPNTKTPWTEYKIHEVNSRFSIDPVVTGTVVCTRMHQADNHYLRPNRVCCA
jgi:hypothetical protein